MAARARFESISDSIEVAMSPAERRLLARLVAESSERFRSLVVELHHVRCRFPLQQAALMIRNEVGMPERMRLDDEAERGG